MKRNFFLLLLAGAFAQNPLIGNVSAVYDLLERVIPGSSSHFVLSLSTSNCANLAAPCFLMEDQGGQVAIKGSSASELTAALGTYFREYCNMTIGWPRGGGSNIFTPSPWPALGSPISRRRIVPWSYIMNVCTHSYSLVWYDWAAWSAFIDWMALSGINMALAMTGQEEVQYKMFAQLGVSDNDIRSWFNGPAFLTWSRGQNEYGNDISGPLPRSWMQAQWSLQKQILARYRSLGITSQLPGFQGNVPAQLKSIFRDSNMTLQGDTAWMDSLDPLYGQIADLWMSTLLADFGTDHWYQLDGYFNGGTAPWLPHKSTTLRSSAPVGAEACTWTEVKNAYLASCSDNCADFGSVAEAQVMIIIRCGEGLEGADED
jgi:alpha-N-acetylglucosaminidase